MYSSLSDGCREEFAIGLLQTIKITNTANIDEGRLQAERGPMPDHL
jgi:hypothetical protein